MNAKRVAAVIGAGILLLAAPTLAGQAPGAPPGRPDAPVEIRMRFNRDLGVAAGDSVSLLVVGGADATVAGTVGAVLVLGGTAELLPTARVGHLTVANGAASLRQGAVVQGDVQLLDSELRREPGVTVAGEVVHGYRRRIAEGLRTFGLLIGVGVWLAVLLGGLVATGVAPGGVRRAGRVLTAEPGTTALAAVVLWIAAPFAAVAVMGTVVGLPIGLGLFVFILPTLAFLGYLVCGIRLGDVAMRRMRSPGAPERPFLAAALGLFLLPVLGMIPVLGGWVTMGAVIGGSGAVLLATWRGGRTRGPHDAPVPADPRILAGLNEPAMASA